MVTLNSIAQSKGAASEMTRGWDQDEMFGNQILNGAHPTRIQRLDDIPERFAAAKNIEKVTEGDCMESLVQVTILYKTILWATVFKYAQVKI